jgi:hydrogenase nickel incorporation protein HypA/HybF
MHELSIVNDLFRIVIDVAEKENLSRVDKVHFQLGRMLQVVPELFRFAFDSAKVDTIAREAELEIEFVPVKMKCKHCGHTFEVNHDDFYCPLCKGVDLDLLQGKELFIKSIEGE